MEIYYIWRWVKLSQKRLAQDFSLAIECWVLPRSRISDVFPPNLENFIFSWFSRPFCLFGFDFLIILFFRCSIIWNSLKLSKIYLSTRQRRNECFYLLKEGYLSFFTSSPLRISLCGDFQTISSVFMPNFIFHFCSFDFVRKKCRGNAFRKTHENW